jgi:hypothetical protein
MSQVSLHKNNKINLTYIIRGAENVVPVNSHSLYHWKGWNLLCELIEFQYWLFWDKTCVIFTVMNSLQEPIAEINSAS